MKIVMLGHTGVGKTTYMASMYGTLQTAINGFSIHTKEQTQHLELVRAFNAICRNTYPNPSMHRSQYDFYLHYQGRAVFPFCWVDYRGKALVENMESQEARQLITDLKQADAILIFCDADAFARGRGRNNQIGRMMNLVGRAIQEQQEERPVPIATVFTKADLVEELDEELTQPVSGLVEAIARSKWLVGALIPVACGQQFLNVEMPVLFTLFVGISLRAQVLSWEIEMLKQIYNAWKAESETLGGMVKDFFRGLIDEPTSIARARSAQKEAQERLSELETIAQPAQQLSEYLGELGVVLGTGYSDNDS